MAYWKNECELFKLLKCELFTAVIGDIMDKMGLQNQFLPPQLRPLRHDMLIAGRAMPVLEADVNSDPLLNEFQHLSDKPFGIMLEALDDLKENEIYICTGASPTYALWGELMTVRAMKLGCGGAVVNGYSRDTPGILALDFPVFSYGPFAQDQGPRGKVIDFRIPINMGGVEINPGDIVVGDMDGVCIIPSHAENEIISLALEKARGEKVVHKKITEGMGAKEAFDIYGII